MPVIFWSCSKRKTSKDAAQPYELIRFESIFFDAHPDSLSEVEKRFPYFFPKTYPFSVWVNRRTDSLQLALYEQTKSISNSDIQDQLTPFMKGLPRVFENAELYINDAENFLKQGKDENAVLSIGYADGLVDALRMAKGIEPKI